MRLGWTSEGRSPKYNIGIGIGIGIGTESSISDTAHHCRGVKCLRAGEDRGQREELDFSTCLALSCHW